MAVVWIPSLMRDLTADQSEVQVSGQTVGEVIDVLDRCYPGLKARLCVGNQLDPAIAVSVDGRISARRLLEPVGEESEIHFVPAVAGG